MPNILHISTYAHGGAAIAMRRLSDRLAQKGIASSWTARFDYSRLPWWGKKEAQFRSFADKYSFRYSKHWDGSYFSPAVIPSCGWLAKIPADHIIHAHWLGAGALRVEEFSRLPGPLLWTLHDEWLYTGGCHAPVSGCAQYARGCGRCPALGSTKERDLSRRVWERKDGVWPKLPLAAVIAPSNWIADRARKSPLLAGRRIEVIPNPINTATFSPLSKEHVRGALGLPLNEKILFFPGGVWRDPVRGIDLLEKALKLFGQKNKIVLCVIGRPFQNNDFGHLMVRQIPVAIEDETMRQYYTAADATLMPSRIANFSNTLIESLACGTPAVAFDVGGNGEIVDHQRSGYLAAAGNIKDFAEGIAWVLTHNELNRLGSFGRLCMIERFSDERVLPRFMTLYEEIARGAK